MSEDHLITCLKRLCQRFSDDPLLGRYEVARKSKLSEQYLYQIIAGKPMQGGAKRSIGKVAREKITRAFPDWLVPTEKTDHQSKLEQENVAEYRVPAQTDRPLVTSVTETAKKISDEGLRQALGYLERMAVEHPMAKERRA